MASLGTVGIDFEARTQRFNRAMDNMTRRMTRFGTNASRTQRRVSSSTIAIGNAYAMMGQVAVRALARIASATLELVKDSATMAIQFENNMMQVEKIFGSASESIEMFANNQARALGMSTSDAIAMSRVYGRITTGIIGDQTKSAEITQQLLKQSAIVANATGRSMQDVMERIRSGLRGETDAIEDLEIEVTASMLETTKAFRRFAGDKSWNQLNDKTKKQIRLFGILEQSMRIGTSVQQNTNASLQTLNATLDDFKLKLGQAFLPIIQRTVPILIRFAEVLVDVGEKIRLFSNYLFEIEDKEKMLSKSGEDAAGNQKDLGNEIDKAAKSASKSLAPFDKLNNMMEKIATPSGLDTGKEKPSDTLGDVGIGDGSFIGPPVPKAELSSDIKAYVDSMKDGFKEVKTEAQNNRKWLKNFWKTKIITDAEAKEMMSNSGFKTYFDLWERFYAEEVENTETRLNDINVKYDEFFTGLQSQPWNGVKMNWWEGMQNTKKQMDKSLLRMEQSVDKTVGNIKDTDWTPVENEWGTAFEGIKNRVDGYLGGIETSVTKTTTNVLNQVNAMKTALASVGGLGGFPAMVSPTNFTPVDDGWTLVNDDFPPTATGIPTINGDSYPRYNPEQTQKGGGGGSFGQTINVTLEIDKTPLAKVMIDPLNQEMKRRGNTMIKSGQVNNSTFAGGGN